MSMCPRVRLPVCLPVCLSVCLFSGLAAPPAGSYCFTRRPGLWARGRAPAPHVATAESGLAATARAPVPSPTSSPPRPTRGPRNAVGVGQRRSPAPQSRAGWAGRGAGGVRSWLCPPCPRVCVRTRRGRPGTCGLCPRWPPLPSARRHATRVGRGRALRQLLGETLARFRPPLPAFWLSAGSREPPAAPLTLCRRPFWAKPGAPVGVQLTLPRVMLGVGP